MAKAKTTEAVPLKLEFKCPKCGAVPHEHGKKECLNEGEECEGIICECDPDEVPDQELEDHGTTFENPCIEANCYHCGWGGSLPVKPKGLQAWEKKALEAGWAPPAARKKELGFE